MSFAAAAALIGTYERVAEYRLKRNSSPPSSTLGNWMYAIRQNIFGMILVPVVAGLATALFAAYHFYRIAPLGLLANFLAMPIVSFAVMPLALLSVLLMPFGLEQFTLPMLGVSLKSVVDIAAWVADLGPSGSTGKISRAALLWGSLGLIIATLARSRLKLVAIPCLAVAISVARAPSPLFLVSESGRQVAILSAPGVVITSKPNAEKFISGIWKQAYGQHSKQGKETNKTNRDQPVRNCDTFGCTLKTAGLTLTHLSNTARLATDCLRADILVVPYSVPWACEFLSTEDRPLIIDRRRLQRFGAHAIHLTKTPETRLAEPIEIITARSGARRPWSTD